MFWKEFAGPSAKEDSIETLCTAQNFDLEKIIDREDFLQEVKALNPTVLDASVERISIFFKSNAFSIARADRMEVLLGYIIHPSKEGQTEARQYKFVVNPPDIVS